MINFYGMCFLPPFFFFFWLCHVACRILLPDQGSNPCPLQWKHRVLTTTTIFKGKIFIIIKIVLTLWTLWKGLRDLHGPHLENCCYKSSVVSRLPSEWSPHSTTWPSGPFVIWPHFLSLRLLLCASTTQTVAIPQIQNALSHFSGFAQATF